MLSISIPNVGKVLGRCGLVRLEEAKVAELVINGVNDVPPNPAMAMNSSIIEIEVAIILHVSPKPSPNLAEKLYISRETPSALSSSRLLLR